MGKGRVKWYGGSLGRFRTTGWGVGRRQPVVALIMLCRVKKRCVEKAFGMQPRAQQSQQLATYRSPFRNNWPHLVQQRTLTVRSSQAPQSSKVLQGVVCSSSARVLRNLIPLSHLELVVDSIRPSSDVSLKVSYLTSDVVFGRMAPSVSRERDRGAGLKRTLQLIAIELEVL